jgi:maleate cis-trans isomerase
MAQVQRPPERRIGVIVPAGNIVHEYEFARMRPEGVRFRFAPFVYPARDASDFCGALIDQFAPPLKEMRAWGAEAVLVGCTTASMLCGAPDHVARMERLAGVPVVTAAGAVQEAMNALGLKSVAVATPYGARSNAVVSEFLERSGVRVSAIAGFGYDSSPETWREKATTLTPPEVTALCLSVDRPDAQGLYLPCTGIRSVEALAGLERDRGKPALSSVQVGFWAALHRLGLDGRQEGFGHLIAQWNIGSA